MSHFSIGSHEIPHKIHFKLTPDKSVESLWIGRTYVSGGCFATRVGSRFRLSSEFLTVLVKSVLARNDTKPEYKNRCEPRVLTPPILVSFSFSTCIKRKASDTFLTDKLVIHPQVFCLGTDQKPWQTLTVDTQTFSDGKPITSGTTLDNINSHGLARAAGEPWEYLLRTHSSGPLHFCRRGEFMVMAAGKV